MGSCSGVFRSGPVRMTPSWGRHGNWAPLIGIDDLTPGESALHLAREPSTAWKLASFWQAWCEPRLLGCEHRGNAQSEEGGERCWFSLVREGKAGGTTFSSQFFSRNSFFRLLRECWFAPLSKRAECLISTRGSSRAHPPGWRGVSRGTQSRFRRHPARPSWLNEQHTRVIHKEEANQHRECQRHQQVLPASGVLEPP
jgi:hypothetical protein